MGYMVLQTADREHWMIIMALEDEDVESAMTASSPAYLHIPLSQCVPNVERLLHEHVLLTIASERESEDELNNVIENQLEIDQAISNVQVCVLAPEIIQKLRARPAESHMFHLGDDLPLLVVVLGGQKGLDCWVAKNLEKAE